MTAWPASLPQEPFEGLHDQRQDARIRTAMDAGPAKVRRRWTAAVREINVPIVLTGTQRATFDTFYITTLEEGSLPFDWTDPVDDSTVSYRFVDPPDWVAVSGGETPSARLWQSTMKLEILP